MSSVLSRPVTLESVTHTPELQRDQRPVGAYLAFASICVLWGTTFLAIRISIETIPAILVTGLRFLGAGLILLVFSRVTRARFPLRSEWPREIFNGVLMFAVGNGLIVWAEQHISSGLTALLAATIPIWMGVLESGVGLARFTAIRAVGLSLGFGGVALLVAPAIGQPDVSLLFFLAVAAVQVSSITWGIGTIRSKLKRSSGDGTAIAAIQMLSGGVVAMLFALATGQHHQFVYSNRSFAALMYLMVFGSVIAYSAYIYALRHISAGKLSSYAYMNPLIAVVAGAMVLGERVTLPMIAAMLFILGGVGVIQLEKRKESR
jgi:drug/metabolite transporter (DMT)-like permease